MLTIGVITYILFRYIISVKLKNFQFGAGLARSHVYGLYLGGAAGSGTASVQDAGEI